MSQIFIPSKSTNATKDYVDSAIKKVQTNTNPNFTSVNVANSITANSSTISGALTAGSAVINGSSSANSSSITGALSSGSLSIGTSSFNIANNALNISNSGTNGINLSTSTGTVNVSNNGCVSVPQLKLTQSDVTTSNTYAGTNGIFGASLMIRSGDNNHRILFDNPSNIFEIREYGNIILSSGSTNGNRTNNFVLDSNGNVTAVGYILSQNNISTAGKFMINSTAITSTTRMFSVGMNGVSNITPNSGSPYQTTISVSHYNNGFSLSNGSSTINLISTLSHRVSFHINVTNNDAVDFVLSANIKVSGVSVAQSNMVIKASSLGQVSGYAFFVPTGGQSIQLPILYSANSNNFNVNSAYFTVETFY